MTFNDLAITSLDDVMVCTLTDEFMFIMDELHNLSINQTQEKQDIIGKNGRKLNSLKKNKAVTVSGTNGLISAGMVGVQTGTDFAEEKTTIKWTERKTVTSGAVSTDYVATGVVGNEIGKIYLIGANGVGVKEFVQGAELSAGVFTYDPKTKEIEFFEGDVADESEIAYYYNRTIVAPVHKNMSDKYSGKCKLYINGLAEDKCSNIYKIQFCIPKADLKGEFGMEMGGDQSVHNFEAESLAGACGTGGELWSWVVFGVDTEDAA